MLETLDDLVLDAALRIATRERPVVKAARRQEPAFTRAFLGAVREAQAAIDMGDLEAALEMPGTGAALYVLQPVFDMFLEPTRLTHQHHPYYKAAKKKATIKDAILTTMNAGAAASKPKLGMQFDATNTDAVAVAEAQAAELVTSVTAQARDAMRTIVAEGIEAGENPRTTAKLIRSSIGLTDRDAGAVMKRLAELHASGDPKAAVKAEKYAAQLTKKRAITIARTETMRAANEGQSQLWHQAQDAGLLSQDAQKVWITADPCPICEPLEGEVVGLNDDFSIGDDPPAHPNCRCTPGLVEA